MSAHGNLLGAIDAVLFLVLLCHRVEYNNDIGIRRPIEMVEREIQCKKMVVKGKDVMQAS